jgi:hypothetical protein
MSLADDLGAQRYRAIEDARDRIAYGKHFPLRQLAENLTILREMLVKQYGTLKDAAEALESWQERENGALMVAHELGTQLLQFALINPKLLSLIAEFLGKPGDKGAVDPRAEQIITAYEYCLRFPPSFTEVRDAFICEFGESRWPDDFGVRKTLRFLDLPLRKSKRGRPSGAKSKI